MKLKVQKSKSFNPASKKSGFAATAKSNGKVSFEDLCKEAGHNTSMHEAEVEACCKLFCEAVANQLKNGMIVDMGKIGSLAPSVTSGWFEKEEDLTMDSVKPKVNYTPADDIKAAILGASLTWTKVDKESSDTPETPTNPDGGDMSME